MGKGGACAPRGVGGVALEDGVLGLFEVRDVAFGWVVEVVVGGGHSRGWSLSPPRLVVAHGAWAMVE